MTPKRRKSFWSHSYSSFKKLNGHGDVVQEGNRKSDMNSQRNIASNASISNKVLKYAYVYDEQGNWTEKFQIIDSRKELLSKRVIEYY